MKSRLLTGVWIPGIVVLCSVPGLCAPFQLVSQRGVVSAPAGGSGDSWGAIISPDGRFVLFASAANNLVSTTNGQALPVIGGAVLNVFLRDRANNTTTLVSANLAGTGGGNGDSIPTALSTNGQFACFESSASNVTPNDTNGVTDVFVRDLFNNTTTLVSAATNSGVGNGTCRGSVMTPDGHYVAFVSTATSLVSSDTNGIPDVFVRDLQSGLTTVASVGARSTNSLPLSSSESPEITPDGRYVAFYSSATNLVPGVTHGGEIYVRDLLVGTTICASTNAHTFLGPDAFSFNHAISTDGLYVAYEASSNAPATAASRTGYILRFNMVDGTADLVNSNAFVPPSPAEEINNLDMSPDGRFITYIGNTNDTSGTTSAIFRWDAVVGAGSIVSADMSGNAPTNSICDSPRMDPTGRYIAFLSSAPSLATNALISGYHLYLRDTTANTTTLLDADTNGVGSSVSPATVPRLNDSGDSVAFESFDASLAANDRNHNLDLFVRDVFAASNILVSVPDASLPSTSPNGSSMIYPRGISADGRRIVFSSEADNLVEIDTNGFRDVFVRDLSNDANILASAATNGLPGDNLSYEGAMSANGRFVVFTSSADNLVAGDSNKREDVFVRDLASNTTALVSVNLSGTASGNQASHTATISADGRFVAFRSSATDLASGSFSRENLFVRDLNSGVSYALTTGGVGAVASTGDGRFVAFSGGPTNTVYVWDTAFQMRVYTNVTSSPILALSISDDGNRLAYVNVQGTFVADRVAHASQQVTASALANLRGLRFTTDGRYIVYSSANTSTSRLNNTNQVYVYDFQTRISLPISQNPASAPGNGTSDSPDISSDGRFIVYRSFATDIAALAATNGTPNLYLYDRAANSNALLTASLRRAGTADNRSRMPVFSDDGRTLVFDSAASDLSAGDFNANSDVFALSLLYATVSLGVQGPTVSWPARPGETYHVQFKDSLNDANWQEAAGVITFAGGRAQLSDLAPSSGQRFYRVATN